VRAPRDVLAVGVADRLPHARAEASRVADLFEGARLLLADDASIEAFVAASGAADVIHVACHAQFRDDSPMFSALYLHDGAFTAENAERLRLRPGIVVLSGCETGASEHGAGDEMIGLVRAFFVGGAARVLASHWPVDDAVTAEIIGRFYRALGAGSTCAAAIRVAQRAVMQRHPHPFYWSAFSVYGGW
jgi:CHAT domain-containing protein